MPKKELKGTPASSWSAFLGFITNELAVNGPDPHMIISTEICKGIADQKQKAWFTGLYIAPYNIPTAEVLFHYFPTHTGVLADPEGLGKWIKDNWKSLVVRRERRPVMAPHKLTQHILNLAQWIETRYEKLAESKNFNDSFEMVSEILYNGRYATMKLYEALRRNTGLPLHEFTDVRPHGGWSPRLMMSWIYPERDKWLNGSDNPENLRVAGLTANEIMRRLKEDHDIHLDWFNLEVMLCDTKQAIDGKQYPGRAHDSEMAHHRKLSAAFPEVKFKIMEARAKLFPHEALGEFQGWDGRRDECSDFLGKTGNTWSDLKYDYLATMALVAKSGDPETFFTDTVLK